MCDSSHFCKKKKLKKKETNIPRHACLLCIYVLIFYLLCI